MNPAIIQSGITPADPAAQLQAAMQAWCESVLAHLRQAEQAALARLEQYVPQDRLLDLKEAATYLKYSPRWLDENTRGAEPKVQFSFIGGQKRFRKLWLDQAVERGAVKPRERAKL